MSLRVWENLPSEYRIGSTPDEPITVWRGDILGRENTGVTASINVDAEGIVFNSIFSKYPNLKHLVKRHCQSSSQSPFISLTSDLNIAEFFSKGRDSTIYEITVPAFKLVADPPSKTEINPVELLAIGIIDPEHITGVLRTADSGGDDTNIWDRSMTWVK